MQKLKAIDLRDLLLLLGGALLGTGSYLNWGMGWAMIVLALLLLVPIVVTSWRP